MKYSHWSSLTFFISKERLRYSRVLPDPLRYCNHRHSKSWLRVHKNTILYWPITFILIPGLFKDKSAMFKESFCSKSPTKFGLGRGVGKRGKKYILVYTANLARHWHFAKLLAKLKKSIKCLIRCFWNTNDLEITKI